MIRRILCFSQLKYLFRLIFKRSHWIIVSLFLLNISLALDFIKPTSPNRDGNCDEELFMDCNENCYPSAYLTFLNNDFCDEGTYGIDLSCVEWGYDGANCSTNWSGDLGSSNYVCNGENDWEERKVA